MWENVWPEARRPESKLSFVGLHVVGGGVAVPPGHGVPHERGQRLRLEQASRDVDEPDGTGAARRQLGRPVRRGVVLRLRGAGGERKRCSPEPEREGTTPHRCTRKMPIIPCAICPSTWQW